MFPNWVKSIIRALPEVSRPKIKPNLKEKLKWTVLVLILYFLLAEIPLYGLSPQAIDLFGHLRAVLAGTFGSVITLGIGPIVTAGLILQLFVGGKILPLDTSTREGRQEYQGLQKLLAIGFTVLESAIFVLRGGLTPINPSLAPLLIGQLLFAGILIIYLDELVSNWGIGSGISLFIAAGVCRSAFVGLFNPIPLRGTEVPTGIITGFFYFLITGSPAFYLLIPVFGLLITLFISLYAWAMRVDLPLSFGRVKGYAHRWPLQFIYASNLPVILTAALLANFRFIALAAGVPLLGEFDENQNPTGGLMYYLTPPNDFIWNLIRLKILKTDLVRATTYLAYMILGSILFAILWVEISGAGPADMAERLRDSELHIPGFRRDKRVIKSVLDRYIPYLTILGGAMVGFLAGFLDLFTSIVSGTGILLTVGIIQQVWEQLKRDHEREIPERIKKVLE